MWHAPLSYCRGLCEPPSVTFSLTWIWSASWAEWIRCGWPSPWWAGAGGRRRGSPPHTSTGACSSWSWPAGTQRCAPAHGPAVPGNEHTTRTHCSVIAALVSLRCDLGDETPTWSSSSTTTRVRRLFLKSSRVILGLTKKQSQGTVNF